MLNNNKFIFIIIILIIYLILIYFNINETETKKEKIINEFRILASPNIYRNEKVVKIDINKKYIKNLTNIINWIKYICNQINYKINKIDIIENIIIFDFYNEEVIHNIINNIYNLNDKTINILKKKLENYKIGPSTQSIIDAAINKNIPFERVNDASFIIFGYGNKQKRIVSSCTSNTKSSAEDICKNKDLTKLYLNSIGVPCPFGFVIENETDLIKYFNLLNKPIVIKPLDGNHGNHVYIGINSLDKCKKYFNIIRNSYSKVIIENMFQGSDHRILIINYKFVAAAKRIPAFITGNNRNTIEELVNIENLKPERGDGHSGVLTKITIDDETIEYLKKQNLKLDSIIEEGKNVYLKRTANLSTGGIAENVSDIINSKTIEMCENIAKQIQLDICGIDLICKDIAKELDYETEGIIEVNSGPGLRMHQHPSIGKKIDVGLNIIDYLFPNKNDGRIPIFSITGVNGKTTTTNLIAHIMSSKYIVGKANSVGVFINNKKLENGDCSGLHSAKRILYNKEVECAVLETARGGIMKRGIGYNNIDIGILTNIRNGDHIGSNFDGATVYDIIKVKIIVLKNIKKNGWVVLNANDIHTKNIIKELNLFGINNIILFSIEQDDLLIQENLNKNLPVVYYDKNVNKIVYKNKNYNFIFNIDKIDILEEKINFQIENVMASIAACISYNIDCNDILKKLETYKNDYTTNPGRMNKIPFGKSLIIADFAHNFDAINYMNNYIKKTNYSKKIISFAPTGDRDISVIISMLKDVETTFDILILFTDDNFLRGKTKQELLNIMKSTLNYSNKTIEYYDSEKLAIEKSLRYLDHNNNYLYVALLNYEIISIDQILNFINNK